MRRCTSGPVVYTLWAREELRNQLTDISADVLGRRSVCPLDIAIEMLGGLLDTLRKFTNMNSRSGRSQSPPLCMTS